MRSSRRSWLIACVALVGWVCGTGRGTSLAADPAGKDPLKDAGLTKAGSVYVLPDETPVLDELKSLRATKSQADKDSRARQAIDNQVAVKRKVIKDSEKEYQSLESRLTLITDPSVHNRLVLRINRMVADHKEATSAVKDLEEQSNKVSTSAKNKFVDDLMPLNAKADAVAAKYRALADDAGVKAAIAKLNTVAVQKAVLGPSPAFTAGLAELKKWESEVESEAIPMREGHGTHSVDVLLNGESFPMEVDTGASSVSLPAEVADKLNMVPRPEDPTVHLQLANGSIIEGKEMTLKSVRVGRFTAEDVPCVVLQKGLPHAPALLGGSFLNHFIVKLDPAANELRLTEIKDAAHPKSGAATTKGAAAATGTGGAK